MLEFLEVMTSFTISVNYGAVKESALIVFGIVLLIMIVAVIKDVDGRALDKAIKVVKKILCVYIGLIIILHIYAYGTNLYEYHKFMIWKSHLHEIVEMYK